MSRRARLVVFAIGGVALAVVFGFAFARMPHFGATHHPYRDLSVAFAVLRQSANAVSAVNFDQRGFDTLGEETILLASVLGAVILLRPSDSERARTPQDTGPVLSLTRLVGYVLLPVTLIIGADVVAHGQLTPGGGFQGGVVLATGLHLLYITGSYQALRRLRPLAWYEYGEAIGMGAVVVLGVSGLIAGAGFLANVLPLGTMGQLYSSGTVGVFSVAVGAEVASGVVVLLAQFLEQDIAITQGKHE
jgi:multicomponent Na+:H+ antiporter subunit B